MDDLTIKKFKIYQNQSDDHIPLLQLPELVLAILVSFLDLRDAALLCRVCKTFNHVITKNNQNVSGISKFKQFLDSQLKVAENTPITYSGTNDHMFEFAE